GKGISGRVDGRHVIVGRRSMFEGMGAGSELTSGTLAAKEAEAAHLGQTVVYVAVDGRDAGMIAIADPIKASTAEAIAALSAERIRLKMLTGDSRATAQSVA